MAQAIEEKKIGYLRSSNFPRVWAARECEVCDLDGAALSMARAAPPMLHARPVASVPQPAVKQKPTRGKRASYHPYLNMFNAALKAANAMADFSGWLKRPATPSLRGASKGAKALPPAPRTVPPFDIQDVPKAMRKLHVPMAAKLQERWFAGQENYSLTAEDLQKEIDQHGARYAAAMVDTTTIKMDWVLSFPRARRAFDELIKSQLRTPGALKALKDKLTPYRRQREVVAWNIARSDFLEFHRKFQFQRISVNASWGQRIRSYLDRALTARGVPDDLTGALGSFNFYATVRFAYLRTQSLAVVTDVSVYVRDPYEFSDDQYLGHWSPSHVAVVPAYQLAGGSGWLEHPVVDGNPFNRESMLYPVTNRCYRDWPEIRAGRTS